MEKTQKKNWQNQKENVRAYLSVSFVGDARNLNFFPSHVAVVAAVAVDGGGAADAKLSSAAARASADPSSPSFGHFQNVMSLVQSEILLVLIFCFFVCFLLSSSPRTPPDDFTTIDQRCPSTFVH